MLKGRAIGRREKLMVIIAIEERYYAKRQYKKI